ncbi:prephenate dehydrogenase [soil metagenome]
MTTALAGSSPLTGPVLIVGCGLMGTSLGLALRSDGHDVYLTDIDETHLAMAEGLGAGVSAMSEAPQLVVIAVPPDSTAPAIAAALSAWPDAFVTDLASVKHGIVGALGDVEGIERYVGGHPMAGTERSGPLGASDLLFEGRAWAITPHPRSAPEAKALVEHVAKSVGATTLVMDTEEHDRAVALVSHLPHLMSVLTAARLEPATAEQLALSGPGLRDVTRIAGSGSSMWQQILTSNADAVGALLGAVRDDIDRLLVSLESGDESLTGFLDRGRKGTQRVPGKHGTSPSDQAIVFVQVADRPGELQRLMTDTGQSGVNIEDIRIDHDLGREVGVVEVYVSPTAADHLVGALVGLGWSAYR